MSALAGGVGRPGLVRRTPGPDGGYRFEDAQTGTTRTAGRFEDGSLHSQRFQKRLSRGGLYVVRGKTPLPPTEKMILPGCALA